MMKNVEQHVQYFQSVQISLLQDETKYFRKKPLKVNNNFFLKTSQVQSIHVLNLS